MNPLSILVVGDADNEESQAVYDFLNLELRGAVRVTQCETTEAPDAIPASAAFDLYRDVVLHQLVSRRLEYISQHPGGLAILVGPAGREAYYWLGFLAARYYTILLYAPKMLHAVAAYTQYHASDIERLTRFCQEMVRVRENNTASEAEFAEVMKEAAEEQAAVNLEKAREETIHVPDPQDVAEGFFEGADKVDVREVLEAAHDAEDSGNG